MGRSDLYFLLHQMIHSARMVQLNQSDQMDQANQLVLMDLSHRSNPADPTGQPDQKILAVHWDQCSPLNLTVLTDQLFLMDQTAP